MHLVAHLHFPNRTIHRKQIQKSHQSNTKDNRQKFVEKGQPLTAVWRNGG